MNTKKLTKWEDIKNTSLTKEEIQESDRKAHYKILMRKLKHARIQNKLTQQELSSLSGVPRSTIARIENGIQNVSILKLQQIVEPMGIEIDIQLTTLKHCKTLS